MLVKIKPTLTFFGSLSIAVSLTACGAKWHEVAQQPATGDKFAQQQTAPQPATKPGQSGFVSTDHLVVKPVDAPKDAPPQHLEKNDKVIITNPAPEGKDESQEAVVVDTEQPDLKGKTVHVAKGFVNAVPVDDNDDADKYFMVQNIATEVVRVYERCTSKDEAGKCINKMIFETEMTAGENTPDKTRRSYLGSYKIDSWFKFYEDQEHLFPSYYAPGYPALPDAGKSLADWTAKSLLPPGKGKMRGSFGWYTAKLTPHAHNQWTHGTFGKGADGEKFIEAVKDPSNNIVMDVRSQGCTRVENAAIAFMREILPVGTKVIKIYAREALADADLKADSVEKPHEWSYVITKAGTMSQTLKSAASLAKDLGDDEIVDKGTFKLDEKPTVARGNVYKIPADEFHGTFLVDQGLLRDYQHPRSLKVDGEGGLPSVMLGGRGPKLTYDTTGF